MKIFLLCIGLLGVVFQGAAFPRLASWAPDAFRYRAGVCKTKLAPVVRALTKRKNMKVCLTVAMQSLSRDNSILSRNFKPLYDNSNKRTKSYDPALRHVMQYTIARRLKMPYLGALPFYSPRKIQDGGRAQGDFTLGVHQMCHYSDTLKEGDGSEKIKRVIHGLSHMDFYGAFDAYRDVILKGIALKKKPKVKSALNQLRRNRVRWIETLNYLISLRRHLEGKAERHTPSMQMCFNQLRKNTDWIQSYAAIKIAALQTPRCQKNARRCRVEFETMDRIAGTVQSMVDINRVCPLNSVRKGGVKEGDAKHHPGHALLAGAVKQKHSRARR